MAGKTGTTLDLVAKDGSFQRQASAFRDFISSEPGARFPPEANRYHLYISYACPWASRTLLFRSLKGLEDAIGLTIVHPIFCNLDVAENPNAMGWVFGGNTHIDRDYPDVAVDPINGCKTVRELYHIANPDYNGRYTVPVFWDKVHKTIVNNESAEIIEMLNKEFNSIAKHPEVDLFPSDIRSEIDRWNEWMYPRINNGVYRCGFATSQSAYETAFHELFQALDELEVHLSKSRYVASPTKITAADVRLFVTIVRFDAVYVQHFKCNKKRIADYPNIQGWLKDLYHQPAWKSTVDLTHIKHHYMRSHPSINPHGIVCLGPDLEFVNDSNHGREKIGQ